ncbi:MAG: putative sulfate exporter family transporter, partial [Aquabacterium sp.]
MHRVRLLVPGLALTGALAFASIQLGRIGWLQSNGISALTLAIVLGMVVGNTVYPRIGAMAGAGVTFSKANLLRLGIILYGLRLTFQDIGNVGWTGVAIDATVLCST